MWHYTNKHIANHFSKFGKQHLPDMKKYYTHVVNFPLYKSIDKKLEQVHENGLGQKCLYQ